MYRCVYKAWLASLWLFSHFSIYSTVQVLKQEYFQHCVTASSIASLTVLHQASGFCSLQLSLAFLHSLGDSKFMWLLCATAILKNFFPELSSFVNQVLLLGFYWPYCLPSYPSLRTFSSTHPHSFSVLIQFLLNSIFPLFTPKFQPLVQTSLLLYLTMSKILTSGMFSWYLKANIPNTEIYLF